MGGKVFQVPQVPIKGTLKFRGFWGTQRGPSGLEEWGRGGPWPDPKVQPRNFKVPWLWLLGVPAGRREEERGETREEKEERRKGKGERVEERKEEERK